MGSTTRTTSATAPTCSLIATLLYAGSGPAASQPQTCGGEVATIVGTEGRDVLRGTDKRDVIVGLGGNDTILGRGGNDRICGNAGSDTLHGGPDRDQLFGQRQDDDLYGNKGRDLLKGGPGVNTAKLIIPNRYDGGPGRDRIRGGSVSYEWIDYSTSQRPVRFGVKRSTDDVRGIAIVVGTRFDDRIRIPNGSAIGLGGSDRLRAGHVAVDFIRPKEHAGDSAIEPRGRVGTDGRDLLRALPGYYGRHLIALRGRDRLLGSPRRDRFTSRSGGDVVRGKGGRDEVRVRKLPKSANMRLARGRIPTRHRPVRVHGVEKYDLDLRKGRVIGTAAGEEVAFGLGTGDSVTVKGRGGDDRIYGARRGYGGVGSDHVSAAQEAHGGPGSDRLSATRAYGGLGDDTVRAYRRGYGAEGADHLMVWDGSRQSGGPGADRLSYAVHSAKPSTANGGRGRDLLDFEYYESAVVERTTVDLQRSLARIAFIDDSDWNDPKERTHVGTVTGIERIHGSIGDDRLLGDAADNQLIGDTPGHWQDGDDTANGRDGADTCDAETVHNCER